MFLVAALLIILTALFCIVQNFFKYVEEVDPHISVGHIIIEDALENNILGRAEKGKNKQSFK